MRSLRKDNSSGFYVLPSQGEELGSSNQNKNLTKTKKKIIKKDFILDEVLKKLNTEYL